VVALLAAAIMGGCTHGRSPADITADNAVQGSGREYVIGPGDTLNIFVYRAPELSVADLPVRPDGRISVPLIPDIVAAGKTPTQLGAEIGAQLKTYVKEPIVTVMVRAFVGPFDRQIRVIGEAVEPAAIPYRDGMTALDVLIQTKGLTKFAAGNRAVIVRKGRDGREKIIHVRLSDLVKDGDIEENVAMAPGDTLIIPQSWF
jgi:polysaccharide biosynthesis/export protein